MKDGDGDGDGGLRRETGRRTVLETRMEDGSGDESCEQG